MGSLLQPITDVLYKLNLFVRDMIGFLRSQICFVPRHPMNLIFVSAVLGQSVAVSCSSQIELTDYSIHMSGKTMISCLFLSPFECSCTDDLVYCSFKKRSNNNMKCS